MIKLKAYELLNYKNWVVVGDVLNPSKYAYSILNSLKTYGFNVVGINPSIENKDVYSKLSDVPYKVEVLNLCINPYKGINIIKAAHALKIERVLIQPGAESLEILEFCSVNGIDAIEGCTLVELSKK